MFKSIVLFVNHMKTLNNIHIQSKCFNQLIRRQLTSSSDSSDELITKLKGLSLDSDKSESLGSDLKKEEKLSFAKAFEKFEKLKTEPKVEKKAVEKFVPFPTLLRYSTFVQMGDPIGKVVVGRIVDTIEDDLYIDFGHKFNGVCKRPQTHESDYVRGAKVRVRINDLEISDRFLGSTKDMTLLEADITLLGLIWSPSRTSDKSTSQVTN